MQYLAVPKICYSVFTIDAHPKFGSSAPSASHFTLNASAHIVTSHHILPSHLPPPHMDNVQTVWCLSCLISRNIRYKRHKSGKIGGGHTCHLWNTTKNYGALNLNIIECITVTCGMWVIVTWLLKLESRIALMILARNLCSFLKTNPEIDR